ncbi:MAG: nucleotidyl transferase AbiEii/AbiGii toxin family protein [Synergistales bacterium]|nr:nucleotidyl transferase AbiEii/AbiGii toxin family protein [Synergistales bacterium]
MMMSKDDLNSVAFSMSFEAKTLEKVVRLLGLLVAIQEHPFLRDKLALKGGTALNLFIFDIPRLSVDIDLNYIGSASPTRMAEERPSIERALYQIASREHMRVRQQPRGKHAGGKWSLRYSSVFGYTGNLEVDLNYMFRIPLWPVVERSSFPVGPLSIVFPVLDFHELAAGKLVALLARSKARDLFDSWRIFAGQHFDISCLRFAFVVYGAMVRQDWRNVTTNDIVCNHADVASQLRPTLRQSIPEAKEKPVDYSNRLVNQCRKALSILLPLAPGERAFLTRINDEGQIVPSLLTSDARLRQNTANHPQLLWKAGNVRQYKHR